MLVHKEKTHSAGVTHWVRQHLWKTWLGEVFGDIWIGDILGRERSSGWMSPIHVPRA